MGGGGVMKIQYMSDLHLEFGDMEVPPRIGDVLILAGDIHIGAKAISWINECAEVFPHVIYILGNHEFYNYNISTLAGKINEELTAENVHLLDNTLIEIEGTRFIGSTLWSIISEEAANQMNDFQLITNTTRPFSWRDAHKKHEVATQFIKDSLSKDLPNVVVTHHCPSIKCIDTLRYPDNSMNTGYYTQILEEFSGKNIKAWVCGHTHASFNFNEEGIQVLGNCRGYIGYEANPEFDATLTYEI